MISAAFDHAHQLRAGIRRRRKRVSSARGTLVAVFIEAAASAGVASHITGLFDRDQNHIRITVVTDASHFLGVAAGGAFVPKLFARAAPVMDLTAAQGEVDGVPVHPGHHQHGTIQPVLGDRGDQARIIETELINEG